MFGWIKRLGRKPKETGIGDPWEDEAAFVAFDTRRRVAARKADLVIAIHRAKRQKKKHSHLAAELARLEKETGL